MTDDASQLWIGTSWKMNKLLGEACQFADALRADTRRFPPALRRFVIPPFTVARQVKERLAGTSVLVGAQNMHWADHGAFTGEISPPMLTDCGLDLVELGHSERRRHFGESDTAVGKKVGAALRHGLIPLICVGETMEEREAGRADAVLELQLRAALAELDGARPDIPVLLAYEPVWAIGEGGVAATSGYADARHAHIIAVTRALLGRPAPCLYGGSVNAENCTELISCDHIDGLFIGRAAWAASGYLDILSRCAEIL